MILETRCLLHGCAKEGFLLAQGGDSGTREQNESGRPRLKWRKTRPVAPPILAPHQDGPLEFERQKQQPRQQQHGFVVMEQQALLVARHRMGGSRGYGHS
jgi:hypothetical protein